MMIAKCSSFKRFLRCSSSVVDVFDFLVQRKVVSSSTSKGSRPFVRCSSQVIDVFDILTKKNIVKPRQYASVGFLDHSTLLETVKSVLEPEVQSHSLRTMKLSREIAQYEVGCDVDVVQIASLVHEVDPLKSMLKPLKQRLSDNLISSVLKCLELFLSDRSSESIESKVLSDSHLLDLQNKDDKDEFVNKLFTVRGREMAQFQLDSQNNFNWRFNQEN
eukprot:TRINITY_DN2796_c0_g1_i1.p1 TRINITY_DN2796_c0_g1~~TRINITY_DN2796_c0_g1_i1.p1  ORF type:complete len:218 (+),score=45.78 TRINITY_DN2796_c0_g1_i1:220-873(+)